MDVDGCGRWSSRSLVLCVSHSIHICSPYTHRCEGATGGKSAYETLPLTVTISDTCDPNPLTSIEVFSDETPLTPKYEYSAVLGRTYADADAATPLSGWILTLSRRSATKSSNSGMATPVADGRFYTVRGAFNLDHALLGCAVF